MNAEVEIEQCLSALFDARARERILTAYESGWIDADDALKLLMELDLIERG